MLKTKLQKKQSIPFLFLTFLTSCRCLVIPRESLSLFFSFFLSTLHLILALRFSPFSYSLFVSHPSPFNTTSSFLPPIPSLSFSPLSISYSLFLSLPSPFSIVTY
uniref:Uncharacterized protein n=1 Tax=Cacopsylla melanoneura TaxID=428564 RepID=A0A8D8Z3Z5_9HEMI